MRGRAIVMHMVSGEAPAANLPQGAVVLVVIRRVLIALEAVWERGGRPEPFTFLTREEANASLWNCPTFEAVATIFVDPLRLRWALCCIDAWDKTGGR
jgi:hypothetical protein